MDSQSPLDQETQRADPNVYKTEEDDEDEIDRRIRRAGERLRRLTIVGAPEFNNDFLCEDTLTVEGGYDTGYAVNYVDCGAASGGGSGEPPTGACCFDDGTCNVETVGECANDGGTYQGDDTDCDPNPCPQPTGACCADDGSCSITTEEDCTGTYQGDDTTCDPNPCPIIPSCEGCGFLNPDDGLTYLTKLYHYTIDDSGCPPTPTVNCIGPGIIGCHPLYNCGGSPCGCPAIILGGSRIESVIAEEHYAEGTCAYSSSNEDITLTLSCYCQISTNDCLTGGGAPDMENCAIDSGDCRAANACPDDCSGVTPPFGDCSVVTVTNTYENLCTP